MQTFAWKWHLMSAQNQKPLLFALTAVPVHSTRNLNPFDCKRKTDIDPLDVANVCLPEPLDADSVDNEVDSTVQNHQIIGKDVVVPLEIWAGIRFVHPVDKQSSQLQTIEGKTLRCLAEKFVSFELTSWLGLTGFTS